VTVPDGKIPLLIPGQGRECVLKTALGILVCLILFVAALAVIAVFSSENPDDPDE
jgi:hypothetical protein